MFSTQKKSGIKMLSSDILATSYHKNVFRTIAIADLLLELHNAYMKAFNSLEWNYSESMKFQPSLVTKEFLRIIWWMVKRAHENEREALFSEKLDHGHQATLCYQN